jgi:HK97 family phage prohead protease
MGIQTKHLSISVKAVGDDGSFEGYGSIFGNIDSYGDIVDKGAFTKTLAERGDKTKLLWQHDSSQPIGIFTSLSEDSNGLKLSGQLCLGVKQADEAYLLLKQGALNGMSIGYQTIQNTYNTQTGINHLTEVKLYEVSLVTFPANEEAMVTSVKSAFEELTQEQRVKALAFINTLTKSLPESTEPPITEASVEKHSEEKPADTETTEEPQADLSALEELEALHSLDTAVKTLERLAKTITRK